MKDSKIIKPRVIVLSGYGLNCEDETAFAFERAGAQAEIEHINDLKNLKKYQILAIPGGFSYGDDTGSGKAFAHKLKARLGDEIKKFLQRDTLMIGICNGFQILTQAKILPGALIWNDSGRYQSEWVEVEVVGKSPWLMDLSPALSKGEGEIRDPLLRRGKGEVWMPIAHGEGKYMPEGKVNVAMKYIKNPNGSVDNIAGILGYDGRVLGMMPHPERAQFQWQAGGQGIKIFQNAVRYFK